MVLAERHIVRAKVRFGSPRHRASDVFTVLVSDWRQSQQDVSQGFGVVHPIEASNFDQLASEDGFQAFVAFKIDCRIVKLPLQNL